LNYQKTFLTEENRFRKRTTSVSDQTQLILSWNYIVILYCEIAILN
jgi:hypothetical protein